MNGPQTLAGVAAGNVIFEMRDGCALRGDDPFHEVADGDDALRNYDAGQTETSNKSISVNRTDATRDPDASEAAAPI